jgi:hypothetical protein
VQVFVIAAKEFADFAIIMAYIMLLLGAAVFAFFQLSGGNAQFLEFDAGRPPHILCGAPGNSWCAASAAQHGN